MFRVLLNFVAFLRFAAALSVSLFVLAQSFQAFAQTVFQWPDLFDGTARLIERRLRNSYDESKLAALYPPPLTSLLCFFMACSSCLLPRLLKQLHARLYGQKGVWWRPSLRPHIRLQLVPARHGVPGSPLSSHMQFPESQSSRPSSTATSCIDRRRRSTRSHVTWPARWTRCTKRGGNICMYS